MVNQTDHHTAFNDELFVPFLLKHCDKALFEIMSAPEYDAHYGVPISLTSLAAFDYGIVDVLLSHPRPLLPFFDLALVKAQGSLMQRDTPNLHRLSVKENVHARLHGPCLFLDSTHHAASPPIWDISAGHIDRLITVKGTIVRTGSVKLLEARRLYECTKCRHRFVVAADLEMGATVQLPAVCPSARVGPCPGSNFKHCEDISLYTNYQEIQVQEGMQCLGVGSSALPITVLLQDELADTSQVGEVVEVTGVVVKQFGPMFPGTRCHVGLALQATSLTVASDRRMSVEVSPESVDFFRRFWNSRRAKKSPLAGRDCILSAICPQLCGLFSVKLASMLMLIGGVPRKGDDDSCRDESAGKVRGEVHFLLIGDPGTGKSQFQRYVSRLSARAVVTNGRSSSAAGLTAAAIKDGAHWSLEAGALVLADGGVCCIDEFDSVRSSDRTALHEAMEQQTCSIAKAGMVTTLHTRTSVFGTCNPRGHKRYNPRTPLAEQLDISGPLLSRFDIFLLLLDDLNPVWDEKVADHILEMHRRHRHAATESAKDASTPDPRQTFAFTSTPRPSSFLENDSTGEEENWSVERMREYIAWVKSKFNPVLTTTAEEVLSGYYQLRRGAAGRHAARTTLRLLESLVRVAQAHARLLARNTVDVQDAVIAVALLDASVVDGESVLVLPDGVGLSAPGGGFADDPDEAYGRLEAAVLGAVRGCPVGYLPWR